MLVDLLAFGPHPDDIEIGMAGTIAALTARGVAVGLCDLTRGERGSNGTPEERVAEADAACAVLGAAWRINLGLPDGALALTLAHVTAIVDVIRRTRPALVAIPHGQDRHPDHLDAHVLLMRAVFDAGLRRFPAAGDPCRPRRVFSYFINDSETPAVTVDVSAAYDRKRAALACYRSQFEAGMPGRVDTRLTSPLFLQLVESRDAQFGARTGVRWAEGFVTAAPVPFADLFAAAGLPLPVRERNGS
jgi:N-acetylglucosamine malate deacetylase 1